MTGKHELRKQWTEALRSGRYAQGKGKLRGKEGYCCLGVAAEVAGATFLPSQTCPGDWLLPDDRGTGVMISRLPGNIAKAYGLRDSLGSFLKPIGPSGLSSHKIVSLAAMNDRPWTFTEIADFIEQDPEQVFVGD